MFIHSTRDKMWLVRPDALQVFEYTGVQLQSMTTSMKNDITPISTMGDRIRSLYEYSMGLNIDLEINCKVGNVDMFYLKEPDLKDFYSLDDLTHMSNLISRKLMSLGGDKNGK